jgi:hypothetical protein
VSRLGRNRRASLPARDFACPSTRSYPLEDAAHIRNALARYDQARTRKCRGGLERICAAAERHGVESRVCEGVKGSRRRR